MLTADVCDPLCGNRGYTQLVEELHDLPVAVWHWLGYARLPPKVDCFRDLLMKLDPAILETAFATWIHEARSIELSPDPLQAVASNARRMLRPLEAVVDPDNGHALNVDIESDERRICRAVATAQTKRRPALAPSGR